MALVLGKNLSLYIALFCNEKFVPSEGADFRQKGKPIALPFEKKFVLSKGLSYAKE